MKDVARTVSRDVTIFMYLYSSLYSYLHLLLLGEMTYYRWSSRKLEVYQYTGITEDFYMQKRLSTRTIFSDKVNYLVIKNLLLRHLNSYHRSNPLHMPKVEQINRRLRSCIFANVFIWNTLFDVSSVNKRQNFQFYKIYRVHALQIRMQFSKIFAIGFYLSCNYAFGLCEQCNNTLSINARMQ
jgi:hypothetical protein